MTQGTRARHEARRALAAILLIVLLIWAAAKLTGSQPGSAPPLELRLPGFAPEAISGGEAQPLERGPDAESRLLANPQTFFLMQTPLTGNGNEVILPFAFQSNGSWRAELEKLLKEDMPGKKLYLSLESLDPLDDGSAPLARADLSAANWNESFLTTLSLETKAEPRYLVVYLCTDAQPKGGCRSKEVFRQGEVKKAAAGRTYTFAYLILADRLAYAPDPGSGTDFLDGWEQAVLHSVQFKPSWSRLPPDSRTLMGREVVSRTKELHRKALYSALVLKHGSVVVRLPGADKGRR